VGERCGALPAVIPSVSEESVLLPTMRHSNEHGFLLRRNDEAARRQSSTLLPPPACVLPYRPPPSLAYPLRMELCPRCGAAIEEDVSRCRACGADRPIAPRSEAEPLPPLPDGGLAVGLPAWLREPPAAAPPAPLLTEADLPPWLLALAQRDDAGDGRGNASDASGSTTASAPLPRIAPLILPPAPLPAPAVLNAVAPAASEPDAPPSQPPPARSQRVDVATAVILVLLALLILLAWASGVRVPGLS
jgi:hypothetical protein